MTALDLILNISGKRDKAALHFTGGFLIIRML